MTGKSLKYMKWGYFLCFFNFYLNSRSTTFDLLPDFVGMFLLYLSLRCRNGETAQEKRLEPLCLILAADHMVHWFLDFHNGVESLILTVIHIYTIYVYLMEVRNRIREYQPSSARRLEGIAVCYVLLQMIHYLFSAYEQEWILIVITVGFLILLVMLLVTLFGITVQEAVDGSAKN